MSAEPSVAGKVSLLAGLVAGLTLGGAAAQDGEPDMEFLEYLGAWEASDEDWMIVSELAPEPPAADTESGNEPDDAENESMEPGNEP